MTRRVLIVLFAVLLLAGCRTALPPHVALPLTNLRKADLFWWTDTEQCTMRLIMDDGGLPIGWDFPVDKTVCLQRLKDEGYQVPSK